MISQLFFLSSSFFVPSLKDINFCERHLQFFFFFYNVSRTHLKMLTSSLRFLFSASLISDNHSKTLVCFFQECPPTLELLWITWKASLKEKLKILKQQQKVWVHRCWKNGWNINKPFNHHLVKWEGTNSRIFKFPLRLVFLLVNYRGMCYLGR